MHPDINVKIVPRVSNGEAHSESTSVKGMFINCLGHCQIVQLSCVLVQVNHSPCESFELVSVGGPVHQNL